MATAASQSDAFAEIRTKNVQKAKDAMKRERRCRHANPTSGMELPDRITVVKRDGRWVAMAEHCCGIDDSPEAAMHRLFVRLRIRPPTPNEEERAARLLRAIGAPSCEVHEFGTKPNIDLDRDMRYVVDFSTNAKLNRGDFEAMICAGLRSMESRDDEDGGDEEC